VSLRIALNCARYQFPGRLPPLPTTAHSKASI
jgi:hypothetical protein